MAWLSAVTLLEWDIVVFWCMVAASLLFLLVLLATVFFQEDYKLKSRKFQQQQTNLQFLLGQKLLPIEPSLGWQLVGVCNNLRVWIRHLPLPGQCSQTLHGCFATVDAEAEDVLAAVQNITKQREWDPSITCITQSSPPRLLDDVDIENPVMTDMVCIMSSPSKLSEPVHSGLFGLDLHYFWRILPFSLKLGMKVGDGMQEKRDIVVNRTWRVERDGTCWMFSKNEDSIKAPYTPWCYLLIQPIQEALGRRRSVLHFIWSPSPDASKTATDFSQCLAMRVAALRQYIKHTQLKLPPLTRTTLQHVSDLLPVFVEEDNEDELGTLQDAVKEKPCQTQGKKSWDREGAEPTEVTNVRVNASSRSKPKPARKSPSPLGKVKKVAPLRSRRHRGRAMGVGGGLGGGAIGGEGLGETGSSSSEDTGFSDWMSNKGSLERDSKAPTGAITSDPGVMTGMIDYMLGDEEPTSLKDGSEELYTLANQCSSELLAQSNQVTGINVNTSVAEQKAQTGGWFFHSLAKEVVILQKNPVQGKYHCFLGKGVIRARPEDVFKAVKNPRTRFIFDNMLKKMDIIKELSDSVQIVHAVHEVPQLLRKESRDFCLLQSSKIEGSSHIVSFTSANVAECPPSEAIPRAHVLPSGWVIEPIVDNRGSKFSMVTYIAQVCIGGKGVPASFIHFLSRRVPLSVAYLRLFVEAENM
ncbi:uncharacterized protein LOC110979629 [Acanthaster planci]|uniref:Uncharacterized protein LOC110979629 n=1 Tax=Acanthaster planci TaxID=133434 RepID=A0A8B7YFD7_ACAPL|nr:uncharacterized protein LOC110979629 [Acanthaster planci]